jgi:hypothetical protein
VVGDRDGDSRGVAHSGPKGLPRVRQGSSPSGATANGSRSSHSVDMQRLQHGLIRIVKGPTGGFLASLGIAAVLGGVALATPAPPVADVPGHHGEVVAAAPLGSSPTWGGSVVSGDPTETGGVQTDADPTGPRQMLDPTANGPASPASNTPNGAGSGGGDGSSGGAGSGGLAPAHQDARDGPSASGSTRQGHGHQGSGGQQRSGGTGDGSRGSGSGSGVGQGSGSGPGSGGHQGQKGTGSGSGGSGSSGSGSGGSGSGGSGSTNTPNGHSTR